jgi:hypothetical protein
LDLTLSQINHAFRSPAVPTAITQKKEREVFNLAQQNLILPPISALDAVVAICTI